MNLLFCGIFCEDDVISDIFKANGSVPFAQLKLEDMLLEGMSATKKANIDILSVKPILRFKKFFIKSEKKSIKYGDIKYLGFVNLPLFKQISVFFANLFSQWSWLSRNRKNDKAILIYGTNPLICIPALILRGFYRTKVFVYVSEIDSLRIFPISGIISKLKKKIYISLSRAVENSFDGYILITRNMLEKINSKNKPYCVIEGMVKANCVSPNNPNIEREKIILYAGSLHKKFGIAKLVEGFQKADTKDYKLVIYGKGDYENELREICLATENIEYRGTALNEEILEYEKKVTLLVNPRPSQEELTKYSFPSKTLEYFSSGTPALITRLSGIPSEYFEHCFTLEEESVEDFKDKITEIINYSRDELLTIGENARKFVTENKNNFIQSGKIINFILAVINKGGQI